MPDKWDSKLIIIQGNTEIESDLLRGIIEEAGICTFHVPSAASALMGRTTSFRFAILRADRDKVENILKEMGLKLDDYTSVKSAYNLDEPFHRAFSRSENRISLISIFLLILGLFFLLYFLGIIHQ